MCFQFTAEKFQTRSRVDHNEQCRKIATSSTQELANHYCTTYGVHRNSILNTLHYFHVTDGLPPDVMHDVLEGVLQYELKQLLLYLISNNFITLELLNNRIYSFAFGPSEASNRPSQISSTTICSDDNSLKQSGM